MGAPQHFQERVRPQDGEAADGRIRIAFADQAPRSGEIEKGFDHHRAAATGLVARGSGGVLVWAGSRRGTR
jgi:hypothetical protein